MPERLAQSLADAEREARSRLATDSRTLAIAQAPFTRAPGGLSNFSWRAIMHDVEWFVRLARAGTERLGADHANECRVLSMVAPAGVAPPVLRCDPVARVLVTLWVDNGPASHGGSRPLGQLYLERLADTVAQLHALPVPQDLRVVDFERQAGVLEEACPGAEPALRQTATKVFARLRSGDGRQVLCHNDLNPSNIVVGPDGRTWLVDWEYAGLSDPIFDLASCASQHALTPAQCDQFLAAYQQAGGVFDAAEFSLACWGFDYVQWLWYVSFARQGVRSERALAESRAVQLAQTLHERASRLPHCNNQGSANP